MTEQAVTGNWGRWGADDERGTLNLITPEAVVDAAKVCRRGAVYSLGLPVTSHGMPILPTRNAPLRFSTMNDSDRGMFDFMGGEGVHANEDVIVLATHNETHIDALCHVAYEGELYNGFPASSVKTASGAAHCGIDKLGPIVGRAVLLDLAAHFGSEQVEPGRAITGGDLAACADRQGVVLGRGDILLVHTGWLDAYLREPSPAKLWPQPGLGLDACRLIAERDIAAVGADNSAIEVMPFDEGRFLSVHVELLVRHGVPLLEHLVLGPLARDEVFEMLLVVAPLAVPGATGSPVNPIAIA